MSDYLEEKGFSAVSLSDIVRFNKAQLGRAKTNLLNAEKRGDKKAATNIKRKMAIYQYTIDQFNATVTPVEKG